MIDYINNTILTGQYVFTGIMDEGSRMLTNPAYTALQSLGLNDKTVFGLRDAFAMIGIKGAAPGSVK